MTTASGVIDGGLLDDLLERTSRTFALAIPLLPSEPRREVGLGYLLFRIADTFEDAERLPRDRRVDELHRFAELVESPSPDAATRLVDRCAAVAVSSNTDYERLLRHTPEVIAAFLALDDAAVSAIGSHVARSARGMAETVAAADDAGRLKLASLEALRQYCYFVAGIVGEMLTDLFARRLAPSEAKRELPRHSRAFGEGLQLVNILKDAEDDARDGRTYLPESATRTDVIALARSDLRSAARYAELLAEAGAEPGVVAFATLPRSLAEATLDVMQRGAGTKVSRDVVARLLAEAAAIGAPE